MLEFSDQEFKTAMINIFKDLMDKVDCMQEQMNKEAEKQKS